MDTLLRDLRYVARSFSRSPGFFVVTALTLALGIGATTAIFSVVNGVLLQPLPYPNSDRIVQLFQINKSGERNSVTEPNFVDWKAQARSFSAIGNDIAREHRHRQRIERARTSSLNLRLARLLQCVRRQTGVGPSVRR
jgi:hypothetical protein